MRILSTVVLILVVAEATHGHAPGGGESLAEQLGHQILGPHHLPLILFLIIVGVPILRTCIGRAARTKARVD